MVSKVNNSLPGGFLKISPSSQAGNCLNPPQQTGVCEGKRSWLLTGKLGHLIQSWRKTVWENPTMELLSKPLISLR